MNERELILDRIEELEGDIEEINDEICGLENDLLDLSEEN